MNSEKRPKAKSSKPPKAPTSTDNKLSQLIAVAKVVSEDGNIDDDREILHEQTVKERETDRVGTEKYYELRDRWSRYIRDFVWAMLGFQLLLTIAIGLGWFDFTEYPIFINLVIGQNFAQIVGMGVIVAKFLFSEKA